MVAQFQHEITTLYPRQAADQVIVDRQRHLQILSVSRRMVLAADNYKTSGVGHLDKKYKTNRIFLRIFDAV